MLNCKNLVANVNQVLQTASAQQGDPRLPPECVHDISPLTSPSPVTFVVE
jgi:hypothetical protein